jgi:hypothetical protein
MSIDYQVPTHRKQVPTVKKTDQPQGLDVVHKATPRTITFTYRYPNS